MFGGVSQRRRSGQGHPADQARHLDSFHAHVRNPRVSPETDTSAHVATRTYKPAMGAGWWLRKGHYFWYMVREFTALPLAMWLLGLLFEIQRAGRGASGYYPPSSTAFVVFSVICLLFALYHRFTFLSLAVV